MHKDYEAYENKKKHLLNIMEKYAVQDVIVAFSGGVDSTLLLKIAAIYALRNGTQVYGVTASTMLHPACEVKSAALVAEQIGAEHIVMEVDELKDAGIRNNPIDRCYLCKRHLFEKMRILGEEKKAAIIIEGTNQDDLGVYRPGIKAVRELGIISPLAEAGMTKEDVRMLAEEYGLSTARRASVPCLATRFPYGTHLTSQAMEQVDRAEYFIKELGFYNVRIRIYDTLIRIEVDDSDLEKLVRHRKEMVKYLKQLGYHYITIDLEGFRSGSMDEV